MKQGSLKRLEGIGVILLLLLISACADNFKFGSSTMHSDVFVQVSSTEKYDFLWVFDNSDSMQDKRDYVKDNLNTFLNTLNSRKSIDYQMAATTTDYFSHVGNLVQNGSGLEVAASTSADPIADFSSIVDSVQNSVTSFWEQGLESALSALQNHGNRFLRNGVPLIVIFLTDEDDYSCQANCVGVEPENNPNWIPYDTTRYIDEIKGIKENEGVEVLMFPIVGTDSSSCAVSSLGTRYIETQIGIGTGEDGSICLADLPASYENVARSIADRGVRFPLNEQSSGVGLTVYVNGQSIPYSSLDGFVYEESSNSIVFTGNAIPQNGDVIEVVYSQSTDA